MPVAHVSRTSIKHVRDTILREKPDWVALELDSERWAALHRKEQPTPRALAANPLFGILWLLQRSLAARAKQAPGAEMLAAARAASEVGAQVALIDMPIGLTLAKINEIPFRERLRIVLEAVLSIGLFFLPFGKRLLESELTSEPFLERFREEFAGQYPNLYRVLIEERNTWMAGEVMRLPAQKVVLVCGAGHAAGIQKLIARSAPGGYIMPFAQFT